MTSEELLEAYRIMLLIREAENRIADLDEAGKITTPCHLYVGQEAIAAGVCRHLRDEDLVWGTHRSHGHFLAKGGEVGPLLAEIFGKVGGCSRGRGGSMHLVDKDRGILGTVPIVAGTIPIAMGAAMGFQLQGNDHVSVAFFGDGAMEEGHFHETVNMAARMKLPVVFICENNLYSSHMHITERRISGELAESVNFHGLASEAIDGNDIEAVSEVAAQAVDRARKGDGPTFLELRTFRWRGHVGWRFDDDVGLTRADDLKDWMNDECDPIARCRVRLQEEGVEPSALEAIAAEVASLIKDGEVYADASTHPKAEAFAENVFVNPTS